MRDTEYTYDFHLNFMVTSQPDARHYFFASRLSMSVRLRGPLVATSLF